MADNQPPTPPPNSGLKPTLPHTGMTGRLPFVKKTGTGGKIVVMLSSVAKPPPAGSTQSLLQPKPAAGAVAKAEPTPAATPTPAPAATPTPPVQPAPAPTSPPPASTQAPTPGIVLRPPVLPPKQVTAAKPPVQAPPKLSTTTYVKLPPKTSVPQLTSLTNLTAPAPTPEPKIVPSVTPAPPKITESARTELKKPGAQHIPPIKLNEMSTPAAASSDSLFLKPDPTPVAPKTEVPKTPAPFAPVIEAKATPPAVPPAVLPEVKPTPAPVEAKTPPLPATPEVKDKAPEKAPPLTPPTRVGLPASSPTLTAPMRPPPLPPPQAKPAEPITAPPSHAPLHVAPPMLEKEAEPVAEKLPPPVIKPPEPITPPPAHAPLHVAPPMLEKAPEPLSEKLPQPHLPAPPPLPPVEARKADAPPGTPESTVVHKAPAMIQPEMPGVVPPPLAVPPKPLQPPAKPAAKGPASWLKKSTPLVLTSTSKVQVPRSVEAKPALKPPTLPKRSMPPPLDAVTETPPPVASAKTELPSPTASVVPPPLTKVDLPEGDKPPISSFVPAVIGAAAAGAAFSKTDRSDQADKVEDEEEDDEDEYEEVDADEDDETEEEDEVEEAKKPEESAPLTRAARAKRRRLVATIAFYVVMVATGALLYFGSLYIGRETRVEGQVIPPAGMTLNNEVWIVSDFRELASGIADDLAKERTPLLEEIQERQDHVQRAQADVASREERIRLVQEQMQAAKDDITNTVKQSRDATQQIWDVDGAQIDQEYDAHVSELEKTIADRAKSLNLKYQPDPTFNSPEVWANAYRLALYEVPTGVDSVKEHQWLSDQMKAWRDYQKSLDDRKEQLRDKAAQIKMAPAPKITDLNTRIDEFQQRIDGTAAEEIPLKAELQQAQADLVAAQSAEASLDDKYYKQLDSLPDEAITKKIPLRTNGRFSWVDDDVFAEGEKEHHYWMFARATRPDGRQYWMLMPFGLEKDFKWCIMIDPDSFVSTKAILRPGLPPDEQQQ